MIGWSDDDDDAMENQVRGSVRAQTRSFPELITLGSCSGSVSHFSDQHILASCSGQEAPAAHKNSLSMFLMVNMMLFL